MRKFQLLLFALLYSIFLTTAISQTPPSFAYSTDLTSISPVYEANPEIDKQILRSEDIEHVKDGHPLRIAIGIPSEIELGAAGIKLSLPDGKKIRQQSIKSGNAEGLILSFKELYIPEGGELYVYTQDRSQVQVYTHDTNPLGKAYATGILFQDEVTLEYVESTYSTDEPRIKVSNIGYVYRSTYADYLSCFINVNCEEAQNWQLQKNGVVGLEVSIPYGRRRDWYICSGSLINNVRQDKTPFILTANHCLEGYDEETLQTMIFEFFKEETGRDCTSQSYSSSLTKSLEGAELLADIPYIGGSDGALLKLNTAIPEDWDVYYNGWDATGTVAQSGVSIHHPNGMVKKISTYSSPLIPTGEIDMGAYEPEYTAKDGHWDVKWSKTTNGQSVTYGGSSGSPLFNQNGHIVGTLTGGESYCTAPNNSDYYGRFSYHWDQYKDSLQHFKDYLDPDNSNTVIIDGFNPSDVFSGTPAATAATGIKLTGFTANWNKTANAAKYWLDVFEIINGEKVYVENYYSRYVGDTTACNIENLQPDTKYHYVIRAGKESVMSLSSNEIIVYTLSLELENMSPVAHSATSVTDTSFVANWEELLNANSYILNVYQKENGDFQYVDGYRDLDVGNVLSYQVTGLEPATEYYYHIVASDGNVFSLNSNEIIAYTLSSELENMSPVAHSATSVTDTSFVANWEELLNANSYILNVYQKENSDFQYIDGYRDLDVGNVLSYQVTGLEPATEYYYHIVASDGNVFSLNSNEINVITEAAPITSLSNSLEERSQYPLVYADDNDIVILLDANESNVFLYDITGKLLMQTESICNEVRLTRNKLSKGIYIIKADNKPHKIVIR